MKYANMDKNTVIATNPKTGVRAYIPRGHRFWSQWGIDAAEQAGTIEPADPDPTQEAV
ncbi:hypothetical protein ACQEXU_13195 [Vibrio sp. TRT 21S02]|uniref:hypothetical protein n=1 Tax=Vibrio sp. TRT 21S02 TaxID=3418507 RepID=UPI003CE85EFA